jgi:hypothetical protein
MTNGTRPQASQHSAPARGSSDASAGMSGWQKLATAIKEIGLWGVGILVSNVLAIAALAFAFRMDKSASGFGFYEFIDYFFLSGNAATIGVGLAAATVLETMRPPIHPVQHAFSVAIVIVTLVAAALWPRAFVGVSGEVSSENMATLLNQAHTATLLLIVVTVLSGAWSQTRRALTQAEAKSQSLQATGTKD